MVTHMNPHYFASQWDNSTCTGSYRVSADKVRSSQLDYAPPIMSQPGKLTVTAWLISINFADYHSGHIICKNMSPDQRVMRKEQNNKGLGLFIERANINSIKITTRERYTYGCLKGTNINKGVNCLSQCRQTLVGERLELQPWKEFLCLDYHINCIQTAPSQWGRPSCAWYDPICGLRQVTQVFASLTQNLSISWGAVMKLN